MKAFGTIFIVLPTLLVPGAGFAFPDGAPWGSANPANNEGCASCHFGHEPVTGSAAISFERRPQFSEAGEAYELVVRFTDANAVISGMQVITGSTDGDAGSFVAAEPDVEFIGGAGRSTSPRRNTGSITWTLSWRAPAQFEAPIVVYVAVSAANDDGSPFGDTIHFNAFELAPSTDEGD